MNSTTGSAHHDAPTTYQPGRGPAGAGIPNAMRTAVALGIGVLLLVSAACSSKQGNREAEQNAKLWGNAACAIAEASTPQDQQNAFAQANHYSATAVQMISSMATGATQIDALVAQVNTDKTAGTTAKFVPDLRAIQNQAASLAKGSSGDESDAWNSLSGSASDCIAQLPPGLQGN